MTEEEMEDMEEGMSQGYYDVECTCGFVARLEPDGECEECGEHLESPLLAMGMI